MDLSISYKRKTSSPQGAAPLTNCKKAKKNLEFFSRVCYNQKDVMSMCFYRNLTDL